MEYLRGLRREAIMMLSSYLMDLLRRPPQADYEFRTIAMHERLQMVILFMAIVKRCGREY